MPIHDWRELIQALPLALFLVRGDVPSPLNPDAQSALRAEPTVDLVNLLGEVHTAAATGPAAVCWQRDVHAFAARTPWDANLSIAGAMRCRLGGVQDTTTLCAALGIRRREAEVVALAAAGLSNAEIARALHRSESTIKTHLRHVYSRTGIRTRDDLLALAREVGRWQAPIERW